LATKIGESRAPMNGQNVGMALYALHAMDPKHDEVPTLSLSVLI